MRPDDRGSAAGYIRGFRPRRTGRRPLSEKPARNRPGEDRTGRTQRRRTDRADRRAGQSGHRLYRFAGRTGRAGYRNIPVPAGTRPEKNHTGSNDHRFVTIVEQDHLLRPDCKPAAKSGGYLLPKAEGMGFRAGQQYREKDDADIQKRTRSRTGLADETGRPDEHPVVPVLYGFRSGQADRADTLPDADSERGERHAGLLRPEYGRPRKELPRSG